MTLISKFDKQESLEIKLGIFELSKDPTKIQIHVDKNLSVVSDPLNNSLTFCCLKNTMHVQAHFLYSDSFPYLLYCLSKSQPSSQSLLFFLGNVYRVETYKNGIANLVG